MKKRVYTLLLTLALLIPVSASADVRVHVDIPLPPPIFFPALPHLVIIPETNVYAVPDVAEDIFFYAGWWWRPWNNRWYRSHYYNRGWAYYPHAPYFHRRIPADWKHQYRNHTWQGYRWEPQRRPLPEIERHWRSWHQDRYWEKQRYGLQKKNMRPAPPYGHETRKHRSPW